MDVREDGKALLKVRRMGLFERIRYPYTFFRDRKQAWELLIPRIT
jgi:hypothetical protein